MSFGMRVWSSDGKLGLDENAFTLRVVLSQVVSFTQVRQVQRFDVAGCTPANSNAVVIPNGAYADEDRQFEVTVGHGFVEVANWMREWVHGRYTATGSMRLIVMRFG